MSRRVGAPAAIAAAAVLVSLCCLAGAGAAPAAPAAAGDDAIARRTLENADQLLREGRIDQALRDLEQVAQAYAGSGVADDALYRIGSYYYPVDTTSDLGGASREAIARARTAFTTICDKYPKEDHAPRARYKLGLIAMDPVNPARNLDEAYASFSGVVNIYPGSDVADRALFGMGYSEYEAGDYDKAITAFERVVEEHPRAEVAQDARFTMGMALLRQGAWVRALEEIQAVRTLYPGGRLAGRALDRLTQVYRLKIAPGVSQAPPFAIDPSYRPALGAQGPRGEVSMAVDADSVLHLLDVHAGTISRIGQDGKAMPGAAPFPGAVSVAVDPSGAEILAAGGRVRAGAEVVAPARVDRGTMRPLENITAAVRLPGKGLAVLDEHANEVLLYGADPAKPDLLYRDPAGRARLAGLAAGAGGRLYTLDRRGRAIVEIAPDFKVRTIDLASVSPAAAQDPHALAADDIGNLYVIDRRSDAVVVMTTDGKVVQIIESRPGTDAEFSYPAAIAVGPRAEIYIYDEKRKTILRFR